MGWKERLRYGYGTWRAARSPYGAKRHGWAWLAALLPVLLLGGLALALSKTGTLILKKTVYGRVTIAIGK